MLKKYFFSRQRADSLEIINMFPGPLINSFTLISTSEYIKFSSSSFSSFLSFQNSKGMPKEGRLWRGDDSNGLGVQPKKNCDQNFATSISVAVLPNLLQISNQHYRNIIVHQNPKSLIHNNNSI